MNTSKQKSITTPKKRKWVLKTIAAVIVILWVLPTIIYPLVLGDGTNGFNQAQRTLISNYMDFDDIYGIPEMRVPWNNPIHVENIRPVSEEEKKDCNSNMITTDANDPRYYAATVTKRIYGEYGSKTFDIVGCRKYF